MSISSISYSSVTQYIKKEELKISQNLPDHSVKNSGVEYIPSKNLDTHKTQILDKGLEFLKNWLEKTTGMKIDVYSPEDIQNSQDIGLDKPSNGITKSHLEIEYNIQEQSSLSLEIKGSFNYEGKDIKVNMKAEFSQEFQEAFLIDENGDKKKKDPLFISYDGLMKQGNNFNIKSDGITYNVKGIQNGGILFKDNNANNELDENDLIYGLKTGNSFDELKTDDSNKDGFISEKDDSWGQMKLFEGGTNKVISVSDKKISLLSVNSGKTNFDLKSSIENPYVHIKDYSFAIDSELKGMFTFGIDFYSNN